MFCPLVVVVPAVVVFLNRVDVDALLRPTAPPHVVNSRPSINL